MADLKTIYRAARFHEPLREQLSPAQNVFFEVCQGPASAPLAWGAILAAVGALLFVGIVRLSVPSTIKVVSDPAGAEVMVDGISRGHAPVVLKDLSHGRHNVEVRQDGFQSKVLSADIGAFATSFYMARLAPVPPKVVAAEVEQAKPQSLGELFMVKGEEKLTPKKADKKKVASASRSKSPQGLRLAAR